MELNEFSYGGIESATFDITCGTEIHSILPAKRKYTQEIVGCDGVIDFEIPGYEVRVITLPIYFEGNYADLRANREKIIAWLHNDGSPKKLIFGNAPDRYYLAKIYAAIDFENTDDGHIGDIQFECNPPWQHLLDGTVLSPEQLIYVNCDIEPNQFIKEFSSDGVMRFVNNGSATKPVIKIMGYLHPGITLSYGEQSITVMCDEMYDGIAIDCNNETVTRMSDNENFYGDIDLSVSEFFEFQSGNCELSLSMPNIGAFPYSVTVIVEMQVTQGG